MARATIIAGQTKRRFATMHRMGGLIQLVTIFMVMVLNAACSIGTAVLQRVLTERHRHGGKPLEREPYHYD